MNDADLIARVAEVIGVRQSDKQIVEFGLFDPLNNPADTWIVHQAVRALGCSVDYHGEQDMYEEPVYSGKVMVTLVGMASGLTSTAQADDARALCDAVAGLK